MNKDLGFNVDVWNKTEAKEMGDFESLKLGGHEVIIKNACLHEGLTSGNVSLKIEVDIAGKDEQRGFFQNQYDNSTSNPKKWSNQATKYLSLKEENLAYTKGFITALEKSNNGFKFDTTKKWDQLIGLMCAGIFGLEEYEAQDGSIKTKTQLIQFRSIDKLNEIKIPRVKKIDGTFVNYEEYKNPVASAKAIFKDSSIEISDEDLPF